VVTEITSAIFFPQCTR